MQAYHFYIDRLLLFQAVDHSMQMFQQGRINHCAILCHMECAALRPAAEVVIKLTLNNGNKQHD